MNQEKLDKAVKYANSIKSRLSDANVPDKHTSRPKEYKEFLEREYKKATSKAESLKLASSDGKK